MTERYISKSPEHSRILIRKSGATCNSRHSRIAHVGTRLDMKLRGWSSAINYNSLQLGGDRIFDAIRDDESGLRCMRYVAKRKFVHDAMVEMDARAIATRFYRIRSVLEGRKCRATHVDGCAMRGN
ncbi:hypothetical protein [Burkholderia ubonensis]|uniref:hypothetical protein n=1 Tax=Burkholderia ubonensis TaxID=101571 RepID=UPI00210DAC40|nr:hypothetical protein [Burkholderia ubonensis]